VSHGEIDEVAKNRIPPAREKQLLYEKVASNLDSMLAGESDATLVMSTMVAVLHQSMPHYFWTGFYRVCGEELLVGPYQGTPACLRIGKGRGVCGSAWSEQRSIVVADVHAFPGHIACDSRSASEIVVPWFDARGKIVAVLDVDSTLPAAFDQSDCQALEDLAKRFPLQ